jgi:hypothetical protein
MRRVSTHPEIYVA